MTNVKARSLMLAAACVALVASAGGVRHARAGATASLPSPYSYVVPPTKISPDVGSFPPGKPIFREPHLLVTEQGVVAVFMEIPPTNDQQRKGWSCTSTDGAAWECGKISLGDNSIDWADPWLADTRGDPCPTYGSGIALSALRKTNTNTLQPIAYYSQDMGRTWNGPQQIPWPPGAVADGSKVIFTGRTYIGFREFAFAGGQYVSRLGTASDPCAWSVPTQIPDGHDHPRMAATSEPGGVAVRGSIGTSVLTFNRFGPDLQLEQKSIVGVVPPIEMLYQYCKSDGTCSTGYEIGQTLMFDQARKRYHHVYSAPPDPTNREDTLMRYVSSDDGGATWSQPVALAGSGAPYSSVGSAVFEEQLAWDAQRHTLLVAYYEKPVKDSDVVELRVRVLRSDGSWTSPVTVDSTPYATRLAGPSRFGDYFGFQARDGVAYIVHHPLDPAGDEYIRFLAVRYASEAS